LVVLKIVANHIKVGLFDRDAGLEMNVGGCAPFRKEAPACCFGQLVLSLYELWLPSSASKSPVSAKIRIAITALELR
jgi:hypothetical protein